MRRQKNKNLKKMGTKTKFYLDDRLDKFGGFKGITIVAAILLPIIDYSISHNLNFPFFENRLDIVAFFSRLASILLILFLMRYLYYSFNNIVKHYDIESIKIRKTIDTYLNNPLIHLLSFISMSLIYISIIFFYVFPILKWKPAHVFLNFIWSGSVGVAFCVALGSIMFLKETTRFLGTETKLINLDPSHPDGCGGFRKIVEESIKAFSLSFVGIGLMIASIPYGFKYSLILQIMLLATSYILFVDIYIIYSIHRIIKKHKELLLLHIKKELDSIKIELLNLKDVSDRLLLKFEIIERELYLQRVASLRVWPVGFSDVVNFSAVFIGYLPIVLKILISL